MTDNSELQRLTRLRRLVRQIAASLPADLDREQAFQVHGYVRELPVWPHDGIPLREKEVSSCTLRFSESVAAEPRGSPT
jgi:hypothetical protein